MTLLELKESLRISSRVTPDNWDTYYWLAKQYSLDRDDWQRQYDELYAIPEGLDAKEMEAVIHFFEAKGFCFEDDHDDRAMRSVNFAFLYGAQPQSVPIQIENSREGWTAMLRAVMEYGIFAEDHHVPQLQPPNQPGKSNE